MKTNNRAEVKVTRELKNKSNNGIQKIIEEGEEQTFSSADVEMEDDKDSSIGFEGPYVGPIFTSKQKKYLSSLIDEKLISHESELAGYFSNLQVEMLRQFIIQKDELEALIKQSL
mmetsp:Transcript_26577/g.26457  ORF Transcript_26577/g.26457 Transcript_26577/m.26457 type:complete len:115 (-) Transcript_26577:8-352(-)